MKPCSILFLYLFFCFQGYAQNADSLKGAQYYNEGMALYEARRFKESIPFIERSIEVFAVKYPKAHAKSIVRLGMAYTKIRDNAKALEVFELANTEALELYNNKDPSVLIHLRAQQGYAYLDLRKIQQGKDCLNQAKTLIKSDSINFYLLAYIDSSLGTQELRDGNLSSAFQLLTSALGFARKSKDHNAMSKALNHNARYFWRMGNIQRAKELLKEMLEVNYANGGDANLDYRVGLSNMGILELNLNEYEKAIANFKKSVELGEKYHGTNIPGQKNSLSSLGNAYTTIGDYENALIYLNRSINLALENNLPETSIFEELKFRQSANLKLKNFELAKKDLDKMELLIEKNNFSVIQRADFLSKKALYYSRISDFSSTRTMMTKAIELLKKQYTNKGRYLTDLLIQAGSFEYKTNNLLEAISFQERAFANNLGGALMVDSSFSNIISPEAYIVSLNLRSDIYNKIAHLTDSAQYFYKAISTLDQIRDYIGFKRTKIASEQFGAIYLNKLRNRALDYIYDVYAFDKNEKWLEKAMIYSELGRSEQLYSSLKEAENFESANLPDSLYEYKKLLLSAIASYQGFRDIELNKPDKNSDLINQYNDTLFVLEKNRLSMVEQIKLNNPSFYQIMYLGQKNDELGLLKMEAITKQETIVSFNNTQSNIYAMVINDEIEMIKLDKRDSFPDAVSLRTSLNDPSSNDYLELARDFYTHLIKPLRPYIETNNLNIITDGEMGYIPFELLIDEQGNYLFENYNIRYSYSTRLPYPNIETAKTSDLLAFAPAFDQASQLAIVDPVRGELSSIPGAYKEVSTLNKVFSLEAFTKEDATETNFKSNASDFNIIHLATHAVVNDQNPDKSKLVFSLNDNSENDGYLHAYEIYNLDLNAQLVTLSACNTGFGKIKKGEGVMSLSRAFAYAGVPATVVSLWPASDKSTPELMKHFYQNLKDGEAKDVALNNARRQYLETATGKARHPFYWGGFVLIGDNNPIIKDNSKTASLLVLLFLIIMLLLILVIKSKYLSLGD